MRCRVFLPTRGNGFRIVVPGNQEIDSIDREKFVVPSTHRFIAFSADFAKIGALTCALVLMGASGIATVALASTRPEYQQQQPADSSVPATTATPPAPGSPAKADATPRKDAILPYAPPVDKDSGTPLYETIQEDWGSLAIGVSKLEPEPPLVAQTEEQSTFTRTLVQVKWRPGDPLDLWIIMPKGVKRPPVVLYLYGYKDDTARFRNNGWCERVTSGGAAAVGFVSALSGPRFQGRPMQQWFVSELQESLGSTVHDVHFILDYLAQRGDVDMNRVGMFGQSSGGTIALLSAAADLRIKAVDALDPWGDWPVWLANSPVLQEDASKTNFTSPEFLKKVAPLDPVKWLPTLKSTKVRIQFVKDTGATPAACKAAMRKAAAKQAEVVEFSHLSELGAEEGGGRLFDWIKNELKSLPEQPPAQSFVTQAHSQGAAGGSAQAH